MTRQYKAMQNEMSLRIHQLESDLSRTRVQLGTLISIFLVIIFFVVFTGGIVFADTSIQR